MIAVKSIDHIVFNVCDVEVSVAWYHRVLGMTREDRLSDTGETRTSMKFGENKINLRPVSASADEWFTAEHAIAGTSDLCFLCDDSPERVATHFRENDIVIVSGPVEKSGAQGSICSVYVRDPDGNLIEVSSYRRRAG